MSNPNFRFIVKTTTDRIDIALGSLFNVFVRSNFVFRFHYIWFIESHWVVTRMKKKIHVWWWRHLLRRRSVSFLYLRRSWAWNEIQSRSLIIAHMFLDVISRVVSGKLHSRESGFEFSCLYIIQVDCLSCKWSSRKKKSWVCRRLLSSARSMQFIKGIRFTTKQLHEESFDGSFIDKSHVVLLCVFFTVF